MSLDWRKALDDQLASQERRVTRRSIAVNYPLSLYPWVSQAALRRDMSMTAYQRRAALAFAEFDLGFDWLTELDNEPVIGPYEGRAKGTEAHGLGFGPWKIIDLGRHAADG